MKKVVDLTEITHTGIEDKSNILGPETVQKLEKLLIGM